MKEDARVEDNFERAAKIKKWYCSRCRKLIQEFEYQYPFKVTGRCSGCEHEYETVMEE